jgi:hypothetical protein
MLNCIQPLAEGFPGMPGLTLTRTEASVALWTS